MSRAATTRLTVADIVARGASRHPGAIALSTPGRAPLTYAGLQGQLQETAAALHCFGLGRADRIALVLPNGPELAAAFLSVAAAATCAPLNPDYRESELQFYLSDLRACALIVPAGVDGAARDVARKLGIKIIGLAPATERGAGAITLDGPTAPSVAERSSPEPGDVALLLHTSGTTSRPKLVPLTQANLCVSAGNTREALALSPSDRCLNVMPLFHIHGLIGATLASLAGGASAVCTAGWRADRFFDWLESERPTWYTAVPTIHQAVVAAARDPGPPPAQAVRRIR
jgi:acyl-CoA synthetase (AMP-forming)/AMP-acid ligase II